MGKTVLIGGRIHNPEVGNVVTGANEILDDTKGKKQNVINAETDAELLRIENEKQDNLTFDNTPTEDSVNPVTSGGVYAAEAQLQAAIEAILLLIPSAASALNQLADKQFVNSSIATSTATFRGTYNIVSDLHLSVTASHADIATALASVVSSADNQDYAFVQVPTSDTSSDIRVTERYKFNGEVWMYEYDLNNSGFTAQQWEAINSTITLALVQKLGALPTAAELATLLLGKQNVLTFDNVPTSGSDNPVKSGGLYEKFTAIDAKMPSDASADNKLVAENRLAAYVGTIIEALDATYNVTSTDGHVTFRLTQADGQITSVQIATDDIASDAALTALGVRVSTNERDIDALQAAYAALTQSDVIIVNGALPSSGQQQNKIYRQPDQDHTPPQFYSDYMWNGSDWVLMATYNNAIDDVPTVGSNNLVKSSGVYEADTNLEFQANSKERLFVKHINYGNFDGVSFSNELFVVNSGIIRVNDANMLKKYTIHHNIGYAVLVWIGNGAPSESNHYQKLTSVTDFLPDGFEFTTEKENIVILVCRDPLSGIDVVNQQDLDNANVYINIAIEVDNVPIFGSNNLVKSRGAYNADLKIEQIANNKGLISLSHINYGNFNGFSFDDAKYAINSGRVILGIYPARLTVHHNSGYSVVLYKGSGIPSSSNPWIRIENGVDNTGFLPDGTNVLIDYPEIVAIVCRDPLSGTDVMNQQDLDNANTYIEVHANLISCGLRLKNSFNSLVEKWIYKFHKESLLASERDFNDKTGLAFVAGGVYTDLFFFDLYCPLSATPEFFDCKDIENICKKFILNRDTSSFMFPMAINLNSQVAAMYSGADEFHYLPTGETTLFMPVVLYSLYENYNSIHVFKRYSVEIESALASIPVDSVTHLVKIEAGHEWVPWGFQEISRFLGNVCVGSAFLYNAYIHLAKLFKAAGDTTKETEYNTKAQGIKNSLQDDSPLWDSENGMYFAATLQNKQLDIYGSAMCVAFDIASESQKIAISDYIANNYLTLTYGLGYCRQSNDGWIVCGNIPSDGSQNYIYNEYYRNGNYQNGLWSVANYWILTALAYHNENIAKNYANAIMNNLNPSTEWIAIPPAVVNPTPSNNNMVIEACAGTLKWVRENSFIMI